jgi:cytochrome c oxidase subunit 2
MAPLRRTLALGSLLILTSACAPQAGDAQGREIEGLYDFFTVVAAVVFVVTAGLIAWSLVRFRRKSGDDALPKQFHANVPLEVVWFAIPQLIVVALFLLSIRSLDVVDDQEADPLVMVQVQGFQWGWQFTYEDQGVVVQGTAQDNPEIVLPTDEAVAFVLTSQDVIHSFYIPEFLMKRDAIPGRDNRFDVEIEDEGVYEGKCAEFCGVFHGQMNFQIRAVDRADFDDWVSEQQGVG